MADRLTETLNFDGVLIVGAGLAGLYLALKLAPRPCLVIAPHGPGEGASSTWAQGGIAAALDPDDSFEAHVRDTIAVGGGLVEEAAARAICSAGPRLVSDLAAIGAPFDQDPVTGQYRLSREAAHSTARVARVKGDGAGRAIMAAIGRAAALASHVTLRAGLTATSLVLREDGRVGGALASRPDGGEVCILAHETVLAAGGVGGLYAVTTNPNTADGAAMALAFGAGATIADPEFVQFHPTAIDVGADPAPLATEALRGEGAVLVDAKGRALVDPLGPRDEVARAVHQARQDGRGAFLDARTAIGDAFPDRFPTVFAACEDAGIDPRAQLIPVAPAAHYHMGGAQTDLEGATDVPGLSAVGEAARTGMHGANRLASNSLLEAGVIAKRAADRLREHNAPKASSHQPSVAPTPLSPIDRRKLRQAMADYAGVVRTADGLGALDAVLAGLESGPNTPTPVIAARLIQSAALARAESRGAHYRSDFPDTLIDPSPSLLTSRAASVIQRVGNRS